MALAYSTLTARGYTTLPAEVRRKLGLKPGSAVQWDEEGGQIVLRRAETPPAPDTVEEVKTGSRGYARKNHGRP